MTVKVLVVVYSKDRRLISLAHIIAMGAERVRTPFQDERHMVLWYDWSMKPVVAGGRGRDECLAADAIIIGAPSYPGGISPAALYFLRSLRGRRIRDADGRVNESPLRGKVGSAFTCMAEAGAGGHELALQQMHSYFFQQGMICTGIPPTPGLRDVAYPCSLGVCMHQVAGNTGRAGDSRVRELSPGDIILGFSQGRWTTLVCRQLRSNDRANFRDLEHNVQQHAPARANGNAIALRGNAAQHQEFAEVGGSRARP
eukprot:scaffold7214_cov410-Prasinococcus_capsulatus_cf.AAC.18